MTSPIQRSERLPLIDALRAFALFGILQVNIQSFVWGGVKPLGFLVPASNGLDIAAYLLVATLVASKFMALFAFLFGYGFAQQMKTLQRNRQVYRRRLWFLLIVGLLHGCLLYFGDVLAIYALCGFLLLRYAGDRPAALAQSLRSWWVAFAVLYVSVLGGFGLLERLSSPSGWVVPIPDAALAKHELYSTATYAAQMGTRLIEYFSTLVYGGPLYLPMVMGLFLLGNLTARQGWLRYPERHPQVWRTAARIGAAGLAFACAGAAVSYITHATSPGRIDLLGTLLTTAGLTTMAGYVACIVRFQNAPLVRRSILWLTPAGRMPLTNYLLQSVIMGALLSGWGLGLGATLGRAELALLGIVIVLAQIMLSRAWIARFAAGPMETLWRRATYYRP